MSEILRVLRVELYRLLRSRASLAALLFLALAPALRVLGAELAGATERARRVAAGRPAGSEGDSGGAWGPFADGWHAGLVVLGLLLLIHAARTLAADRESWVLRLALTRRTPRFALVAGRALLALFFVLGGAALCGASAWLAARHWFDFGPLVEDGYTFFSVEELRAELARALVATLPSLFALWCLGLLVSVLSGSSAAAVSIALALYLGYDLFEDALGRARDWVFASFAPSLLGGSALEEAAGVARGLSDAGFSEELLARSTWLPVPQALLLLALTTLVLARRSL